MATVSPTPFHGYGSSRIGRHPSMMRPAVRRDSPLSALANSQGFSSGALPLRSMAVGDDSEDDDLQPPPQLSALGRSVLEQYPNLSPARQAYKPSKIRISRSGSGSNSPAHDSTTPAPSTRIRRVGLQGAPVRRAARRTPQSEEEADIPHYDGAGAPPSVQKNMHVRIASMDQENMPSSIQRGKKDVLGEANPGSIMKPVGLNRIDIHVDRQPEKPMPLAPVSVNTPHRPAPPPPPPKMSVLEAATAAAGAATTKKRRKAHFMVNGKIYSQIKRLGKGGSSDVFQVMAENSAIYALKKVKLADADEAAIAGYKGEIELLKKLEKVERVVRIIDYQVEEEKQYLYVVMEVGESDLSRILRMKLDAPLPNEPPSTNQDSSTGKLDINFTRFYWAEMLECVAAVHAHDIVHSDLKPANFLLVKGQLKLIDFGIANAIDIDNTVNVHRDSHVGTPNYMSPESLQDASTTQRPPDASAGNTNVQVNMGKLMKLGKPSDVWSLGCILYQMVYGRPPFAHIPNPIHRVMAIINPTVIIQYPLTGIGGIKIPAELRRTLKNCLNRDPAQRPTVAQLLSSKDPFLRPEALADDLRISQELLGQIIWRVAERFRDKGKAVPTDEEIKQYAGSFYAKIRDWAEEG